MRTHLLTVTLALVGCASDGGGDDGGGDECTVMADNCTGETICVAGSCVAAFPRVYKLGAIQHSVPTTKTDSTSWDAAGGAPDLFVTIDVNGTTVATTNVVSDQFNATWPGPFSVSLIAGSTLTLTSYDQDVSVNDPGFACEAKPITAALLRLRQLGCTSPPPWSLSYVIAPQ